MREKNIQIHSLLVVRNGDVVVDAYFYPYDGGTVHDLASVTKSVMTTLIAIAAEQGKLDLDQPMVSFFPDRTIANRDARKERITVRHLASMASGLDSLGLARTKAHSQRCRPARTTCSSRWTAKSWRSLAPGSSMTARDAPAFAILQQATGQTALELPRRISSRRWVSRRSSGPAIRRASPTAGPISISTRAMPPSSAICGSTRACGTASR